MDSTEGSAGSILAHFSLLLPIYLDLISALVSLNSSEFVVGNNIKLAYIGSAQLLCHIRRRSVVGTACAHPYRPACLVCA